jgi:hypothetical protein
MLFHARRLAGPCALSLLVLIAAPSSAQTQNESAETTLTMAPHAAGMLGVEWLGPHPDRAFDRHVAGRLWQGRGAMMAEQQLAQRVIRSWWPDQIADAKAGALLDGYAWYMQAIAIERVFDVFYLRTAHSVESRPYFGGHVIWSFPPLRLSRHVVAARDRYGAVFESLERWLGTPTLQAAMFEVAHLRDDRLKADVIIRTISDAAGQDVSWAFEAASTGVNYAVDSISGASVKVSRRGSGMFTGRSAQRVGGFDSGDGVRVKVVFADGSSSVATWDGRDQARTFTFSSTPVAAYLDPDRVIALDGNRLDHAIVKPALTNVPVRKWVARWMVWLQHTMLSYGFLA